VNTATTHTASGFGHATGLSCRECGKVYGLGPHYACEECFGPLEVQYDYPKLSRSDIEAGPANMWRYAPLLPVPADPDDPTADRAVLAARGFPTCALAVLTLEVGAWEDVAHGCADLAGVFKPPY